MPVHYLTSLTATQRNARTNLHLGVTLAFVAGSLNAGGFLAIGQYTSHMTGVISSAADNLALGNTNLAIAGVLSLASFVLGAATTAVLVNYGRRREWASVYTVPLAIEAALLLVFGFVGATLQMHELIDISLTAILLCFVMGLQNALITKISNAEIRTTHVTGLVTDVGIELGKLLFWSRYRDSQEAESLRSNSVRLKIHLALIGAFTTGALSGALGFKSIGYSLTIPLACALLVLSVAPIIRPAASDRQRPV